MEPKEEKDIAGVAPETANNTLDKDPAHDAPGTIPRSSIKINSVIDEVYKNNNNKPTGNIRTFQSDIADSVQGDNMSMIKIALAEKSRQDKGGMQYADVAQKKSFPIKIMLFSILIIGLVGIGIFSFYKVVNKEIPPTISESLAPEEPEIIYTDTQVAISLDNKTPSILLSELQAEASDDLELGVIKRILITTGKGTSTRNSTLVEFLDAIKARTNEDLRNSLDQYYMLGTYSKEPHDMFMVLKVRSYDLAFPGMLQWENSIADDLKSIFKSQKKTSPDQDNISTSTDESIEKVVPIQTTSSFDAKPFIDRIIYNKDTRVLLSDQGDIQMLYTFFDSKTLIIASSERMLREVIDRMTTGKIRR